MLTVQGVVLSAALLLAGVTAGCGSDPGPGGTSGVASTTTQTTTQRPPTTTEKPATPHKPRVLTEADRKSFARLAASLPGKEGVAVAPLGGGAVWSAGSLRRGVAWSTAKVPVAMAAIKAGSAREGDLVAAITASDNAAAERLWAGLGGGSQAGAAATRQLRAAGDPHTRIEARRLRAGYTPFGQTSWALADQARFAAGMGCVAAGRRVLDLMGRVVPDQRWGLAATGRAARFKGGWGPGTSPGIDDGWLERQMGIIEVGGRRLAVAIATTGGEHGSDTQTLTQLARWVQSHADRAALPAGDGC